MSPCFDFDLEFLSEAARFLDGQLERIHREASGCDDSDVFGHFDRYEYVTGLGFVACQQYVTAILNQQRVARHPALDVGPVHRSGVPMVALINAAANLWKHGSEWKEHPENPRAEQAMSILREAGLDLDQSYVLTNVLAVLLSPLPHRFVRLLPFLEQWREQLRLRTA